MAESGTDLSLATMDELWAEIKQRCSTALLVTEQDQKVGTNSGYITRWRGTWASALGLAEFAKHDLLENALGDREEIDD